MAISKEKKAEIIKELTESLKNAKSVVFTQYSGLSVKDMTDLRSKLRAENISLTVAKKTLILKAAADAKLKDIPREAMAGPIAVAISGEDEVAPARILHTFSKEFEQIKLTGGIVDGDVMSQTDITAIATIPAKEVLYAKLCGSMKAPISGFHGTLNNVLSGFVRVLDAVAKQKAA